MKPLKTLLTLGMILILFSVLSESSVSSHIPYLINYQGMLTNISGNPLTDTVSIMFRIYNDPAAGTLKWQETQSAVPVINGLFNVILGNVNPLDSLDFSEDYWLDLTVEGEHLPSRLQFTSMAYAFRGQIADSSVIASNSYKLSGNTLTDLDSRWVNESQTNAITMDMIQGSAVTMGKINQSSASSGQVIKWNGSAWAPAADESGGTPSGSAGGDLTGTYPNPTIASNAVASAEIQDGTIRGADMAKPCTLSASVSGQGVLQVSNTIGGVSSPAIYASSSGGPGLHVKVGTVAGVEVDSTGANSSGFYVKKTTRHGVEILNTTLDGAHVNRASSDGVQIENASEYGIRIDTAKWHGILVDSAGWSGVAINDPAYYGVHIVHPRVDGILIENAEKQGVRVVYADSNAFHVQDATGYGLYVDSTYGGGVFVRRTAHYGVYVVKSTVGVSAYGNVYGGSFSNDTTGVDYPTLLVGNDYGTSSSVRLAKFSAQGYTKFYFCGDGNAYADAGWSTFKEGEKGNVEPYHTIQSRDVEIAASGTAKLSAGLATVKLDPEIEEFVSKEIPWKITVTSKGSWSGLYVAGQLTDGFVVRSGAGDPDADFDWILIAREKGKEQRTQLSAEDIADILQPEPQTER